MTLPDWLHEALQRSRPVDAPSWGSWAWIALVAAFVLVWVPLLWRATRPVVTITHELGHAVVGILLGRRFSGFVVNANMSGHAITRGKPRGPALILSTWAGYPAPAFLGALLVSAALSGFAPTVLAIGALVLVLSLAFCRSLHTFWVVLVAAVGSAAAWWFADPLLQQGLILGLGAVLLVGAWRHVVAVAAGGGRGDDPSALAAATRVPAGLWIASFVIVALASTAWAGWSVAQALR